MCAMVMKEAIDCGAGAAANAAGRRHGRRRHARGVRSEIGVYVLNAMSVRAMCPLFPRHTRVCTPTHTHIGTPARRTMEILNICLVGFGSVNRALVRLVACEAEWLRKHHSLDVRFSAIVARHGAWEPRSGDYLPPVAVLARLADMVAAGEARLDAGSLAAATAALGIDATTVLATTAPPTAAVLELIARRLAPPADGRPSVACLAEAVDVDYAAGEPATSYLRAALSVGAHAVSANKASSRACPLPPFATLLTLCRAPSPRQGPGGARARVAARPRARQGSALPARECRDGRCP